MEVTSMSNILFLLRVLQNLYPSDYRRSYGSDILGISSTMLLRAQSRTEYLRIALQLVIDSVKSIIREWINEVGMRINKRPAYIRYSSILASLLFVPYATVCAYNLLNQIIFDRRLIPFYTDEVHHWTIYRIILPLVALAVIIIAFIIRAFSALFRPNDQMEITAVSADALLLGVPLTLLTTLILL